MQGIDGYAILQAINSSLSTLFHSFARDKKRGFEIKIDWYL
jgi:hypothetical protein